MSLAVALGGISFASSFLSGLSGYKQSKLQAKMYERQAEIYRRNAEITRRKGALNEDIMRSQKRAYLANANAVAGEVGMAYSPTFATSLSTSASALEQNILNERFRVETEAENYLYQSNVALNNAKISKFNGRNAFFNSLISGTSSGLNVYNMNK